MLLRLVLVAAGLAATAPAVRAPLTPEILHGAPRFGGVTLADLQWHPDGQRVTYLRRPQELSAFDIRSGREAVLFSVDAQQKPGTLTGYRWAPDGRRVVVVADGDVFLVDATSRQRVTQTPEGEEYPELSPDGTRLAYVRAGDLYAFDLERRREWRLTVAPSPDVRSGRLDWVYEEELAARDGKAYVWSPDSRAIAYLRLDDTPVPRVAHVDALAPQQPPILQSFPVPGDPLVSASLGLVRFESDGRPGREVLVPLREAAYLAPQLAWTPRGDRIAYQTLNRRQDRLELRLLDVKATLKAGAARETLVLTETDAAWVNTLGAPRFLNDGRRFVWLSERSGPRRPYLCSLDGACRSLMDGEVSVEDLVGVDQERDAVLVTAHPRPRERALLSVPLTRGAVSRLTEEGGWHEAQLAPTGSAFVDVWSSASTPLRFDVVHRPSGARRTIEANAEAPALRHELGSSRWVDLRAGDGTPLHGRLLLPPGAEGGPPRPAVVLVYGGPGAQLVKDVFAPGLDALLINAGYVVWRLDNRGASGRGHAFESPLHGELGRTELADQLVGVEYLRSLPYVDARRLGILGASYGGYMALYAAVHAPDVFRAAVSGAPVTDWRRYDSIYTERYLGLPADNGPGYDASSILGQARAIRARLLLFHGTADDNVHLAHTLRLVDELNKAGIAHDLALFPGERHGTERRENKIARDKAVLAHFDRWLK